jgi:hypothetical protein
MENNDQEALAAEGDECPICYDAFITEERGEETCNDESLKARLFIQGCAHFFCRKCLTDHCKHAISVKDVPIRCPASAEHACENTVEDELVQDLLCRPNGTVTQYGSISSTSANGDDSADWNKFQRFQRMLQDPSLISCSKCQDLFSMQDNRTDDSSTNELCCPSCGHAFCAIHGDAHPSKTCEQYASSKRARQVKKSEKAIRRFTKPCSHCRAPIQKESGCDHIICSSCKMDMCFKCATHIHLTGDMIRRCENCEQNFVDHRHIWAYRFTVCLSLPFYLPFCILHIIITGVLAIATCGCFCCLGCGTQIKKESDGGSKEGELTFNPLKGARIVFAIVFLPLADLARQCGLSCCSELDGMITGKAETIDDDDVSDEEDGENAV